MKLILASGSPRRAELLEKMGLTFQVEPSNTDEILEPGFLSVFGAPQGSCRSVRN